jgi:peptidoglycan/xylan/chitin deacetylase (PgdA/CDA1 family)
MAFPSYCVSHSRKSLLSVSLLMLFSVWLGGCANNPASGTAVQTSPADMVAITPTGRPTQTSEPTVTSMPSPTVTTATTPTWAAQPPGQVTAPILLYHHIAVKDDRYYISPDVFRQQMEVLLSLGYTGVTVPKLVEVLQHGGELPARPVAVTFDDGDLDVYQNAFPVMRDLGLVGTFYVVGTRLDSNEFIGVDQLREMAAAGWAIGCHSMTHIDLTLNHESLTYEAGSCKSYLEEAVGAPVNTFAYPFGNMDEVVATKVAKYGYASAVGLGTLSEHSWGTLYYLSRLEVQNSYDLGAFKALLPWVDPAR